MKKRTNLKYKNKQTIFGRLTSGFAKLFNVAPVTETITAVHSIELKEYKYLYKNLLKINQALKDIAVVTLNKSEYAGETGYKVIIKLKVTK